MPGNAAIIQREAKVLDLSKKGSWSLPYWVSCLESEKSYWGQSMGESWEKKTYGRGEKKEMVRVSKKALEQSFG